MRAFLGAGCVLASLMAGVAWAADAVSDTQALWQDKGLLSVQFENDLFDGSDRWNTSNQQINYTFRPEALWEDTVLPYWATAPARWIPWMDASGTQKLVAFTFGQQMFTPVSKTQVPPSAQDRPYAGWLYANVAWITQTQNTRDTLQLSLGVVGPWAFAKQVQDFMHEHISDVSKFEGWSYQLPNEPALAIAYERIWRVLHTEVGENLSYDVLPLAGIVVGNVYDYVNAGAMVRFGWNLPDDFGPQRVRLAGVETPSYSLQESDMSFYAFFGAEGRALARNIFLDGSTWGSSAHINKEYVVADIQGGLALRYKDVSFIFSQVFRTKEFEGQPCPQWYCSARLNIAF